MTPDFSEIAKAAEWLEEALNKQGLNIDIIHRKTDVTRIDSKFPEFHHEVKLELHQRIR